MHFSLSSSSSYLSLRLGSCVGSLCCISLVFFYARNSIATLLELQPGVGVGGGGGGGREIRYSPRKTLLLRRRLKILLSYCYHFFIRKYFQPPLTNAR